MSLKKTILTETDEIFIKDCNDNYGCGYVNNDGHLYLIDRTEKVAYMLPDEYKNPEYSATSVTIKNEANELTRK